MSTKKGHSIGDLVVVYLVNSSLSEPELLHYGIIMDKNVDLGRVLVMDNAGYFRWWSESRWQLLSKAPTPQKSCFFS
jgi:hypothetical protein